MNRINWVRPGGFYGYMMGYLSHPRDPSDFEPPLCWIHREYDRSPSEPLRVTSKVWEPLQGALLSLSYGTGKIWRVLVDEVEGQKQGGIVRLPVPTFPTGIHRGRFHPTNGQLYLCGLVGWATDTTRDGGLYRVRYTGEPLRLPVGLIATRYGMILSFPDPLNPATAQNPQRYGVHVWNYRRTASYGSDDYRVSNGTPGRDTLAITGIQLSEDHRSVLIQMPEISPCMQMEITYDLETADGAAITDRVLNTVHRLHDPATIEEPRFPGGLNPPPSLTELVSREDRFPGLALTFHQERAGQIITDARTSRMLALYVPKGSPPSSFLSPGPFTASFVGDLVVESSGTYQFQATGSGTFSLTVNNQPVLKDRQLSGAAEGVISRPVALHVGLNPVKAKLTRSDAKEPAALRVSWAGIQPPFLRQTIPAQAWRHDPETINLASYAQRHEGRTLFASRNCTRCHALPDGLNADKIAMPEMGHDNPSLTDVGARLKPRWLYRWILNPAHLRSQTTMPRLFPKDPSVEARRDVADLTAYLSTLKSRAIVPVPPVPDDDTTVHRGEILFEDLGCIACHRLNQPSQDDLFGRLSLDHVDQKYQPGALKAYLLSPHAHDSWSSMPDFDLTEQEAETLVAFLRSRTEPEDEPFDLRDANPTRGQDLFGSLRCANCHAIRPGTPDPTEAPLASVFPTTEARGCLADNELLNRNTPRFGFRDDETQAMLSFLRYDDSADSLRRVVPAEFAQRAVARFQCKACHARDGEFGHWPVVLLEEGVQGLPPERIPNLSWTGESLRSDWVERRLTGTLDQRPRPWLRARMPRFSDAGLLAEGLAAQHGLPPTEIVERHFDPELAKVGEKLALTKEGGFFCLQCHDSGKTKATASFENPGINFALIPDRLRHAFYHDWMVDPQRFDPQSGMIKLSPDGKTTPIQNVFDGDAHRQFEALWQYMQFVSQESSKVSN